MSARTRGAVFLIEDTPTDRRLLREAFDETKGEVTVQAVSDGREAVEALRKLKAAPRSLPDLVIADLHLPRTSGRDVLTAVRDDPDLEWLPVIMLSRTENRADVNECYAAGANAFLQKPSQFEDWVSLANMIQQFWLETVTQPRPLP